MKKTFAKILSFLKKPPVWFLWLAWLFSLVVIAFSLTFVFIGYTGWLSYPFYVLAACALAYTVYTIVLFAPKIKASVMGSLQKHKFTRLLTEDYSFRTLAFAVCSLAINVGFVLFNTVFALLTDNFWYGCLAGYYFLLTVLRGGLFLLNKKAKKQAEGEEDLRRLQKRNYGFCGGMLFALNIAMTVAVVFMVLGKTATKYTEIMAIVFAAFSVYKIILAIWNVFKAKKIRDWQIQAFRNIGLVAAAFSLLSLQTTLVFTFSNGEMQTTLLNAVTGALVCLLTIGIGVFMIIQSRQKNERK